VSVKNMLIFIVSMSLNWMMIGTACAAQKERINRDDCHVSFLVPTYLEYVEVKDVVTPGDDVCYLAFIFTGPLKWKHGNMPGVPEDWRSLTDFSVTIERRPVADVLITIEAPNGGAQSGIFKLMAKQRTELPLGNLYTLTYDATKQTAITRSLKTNALTIFVLGDTTYSATFYAYPWEKDPQRLLRKSTYQKLFSSFSFIP
jgi:hypothetical protein